jgi:F-type H+-transporting ATPase subunit gamma
MPSTQELTRRIKSVKSTRKITRAMQLVSAAKMRKAQLATLASRNYAQYALELISSISNAENETDQFESDLTKTFPKAKKVGVLIISTNRGLVGGFNNNLLNKLKEFEKDNSELLGEIVVVGKKMAESISRNSAERDMIAQFPKHDSTAEHVKDLYPVVKLLVDKYKTQEFRKIVIIYNHFVSTLEQQATVKQLLPFSLETSDVGQGETNAQQNSGDIIYEPGKKALLEKLLPRIMESQVYQAVLESDASEHSARMIMMKNATESAGDLINGLTLTYNQLRQNKITTELSEITAGKIALEKKGR